MADVIYKDPIKVICIKTGKTKLIKGACYSAIYIRSSYSTIVPSNRDVYIDGVGSYNIDNFTLIDGSSLSNIPNFTIEKPVMIEPKLKDYTGQFVKCKYSSGKSMKKDEIYYVEKQFHEEKSHITYNGILQKYFEYKLKIRGIRNKVSPYHFVEIPLVEQRFIKLKNLKGEQVKTGEQTRKFLLFSEKEKMSILFDVLSRVLIDISKIDNLGNTTISIPDLMVKKGSKYALIEEDIEPFLKSNIVNLIKHFYK